MLRKIEDGGPPLNLGSCEWWCALDSANGIFFAGGGPEAKMVLIKLRNWGWMAFVARPA